MVMLWPPLAHKHDGERVDLLALLPPNSLDGGNHHREEPKIAGLTLRPDRIVSETLTFIGVPVYTVPHCL